MWQILSKKFSHSQLFSTFHLSTTYINEYPLVQALPIFCFDFCIFFQAHKAEKRHSKICRSLKAARVL